jgi:hypothetical protein
MTTTLVPPTSSITSSSTIYYTGAGLGGYSPSDTITISGGGSGLTIGSGLTSSGTISISTVGAGSGFNWSMPEEWDGCFPDWNRIQKMCKEYPALAIAFEKFKTTYKLVKDHYDTPEDQRPLP